MGLLAYVPLAAVCILLLYAFVRLNLHIHRNNVKIVRETASAALLPDDVKMNMWFAAWCGIKVKKYGRKSTIRLMIRDWDEVKCGAEWNISDARCMQLVRSKFNIETYVIAPDLWGAATEEGTLDSPVYYGKSIRDAELTCCKAIYDKEVNDEH